MTAALHQTGRVADNWSCEHEFEELEIEIDGVFLGSFSGAAELALNDARYGDFYVKHIALNGEKRVRSGQSVFPRRIPAVLHLPRPGTDMRTFNAHLFRALEERLYADEGTQQAWSSAIEEPA